MYLRVPKFISTIPNLFLNFWEKGFARHLPSPKFICNISKKGSKPVLQNFTHHLNHPKGLNGSLFPQKVFFPLHHYLFPFLSLLLLLELPLLHTHLKSIPGHAPSLSKPQNFIVAPLLFINGTFKIFSSPMVHLPSILYSPHASLSIFPLYFLQFLNFLKHPILFTRQKRLFINHPLPSINEDYQLCYQQTCTPIVNLHQSSA